MFKPGQLEKTHEAVAQGGDGATQCRKKATRISCCPVFFIFKETNETRCIRRKFSKIYMRNYVEAKDNNFQLEILLIY